MILFCDKVMVKVYASGINFANMMARQGTYSKSTKLPAILGSEGAGEIVEVGEGVTDRKVDMLIV